MTLEEQREELNQKMKKIEQDLGEMLVELRVERLKIEERIETCNQLIGKISGIYVETIKK